MVSASTPAPRGRPRDPAVDDRISQAAIALFSEVGWSGFSVEAVARRARVGKGTIYLRWATKEALLATALDHVLQDIEDIDSGSTRDDLIELTRQLLYDQFDPNRHAAIRVWLDMQKVPGIRERVDGFVRSRNLSARAIVKRGIARGELPESTSVTLLLDTLVGGAVMHGLSTPPELRAKVASTVDAYAESLVDFILGSTAAASARPTPRKRSRPVAKVAKRPAGR